MVAKLSALTLALLFLPIPAGAQGLPPGLENGVLRGPNHEPGQPQPGINIPLPWKAPNNPFPHPDGIVDGIERKIDGMFQRGGLLYQDAVWRGAITATVAITFVIGALVIFHLYSTRRPTNDR